MNKQIKELHNFYLLDNKLLYVSKDFIGYNPLMSKGLAYADKKRSGMTVRLYEFEMGGSSFHAILTYYIAWGPLRGFRRAEILRSGKTIINHERGGMGHGANYGKGSYFHLENGSAFLVKDGYAMRDAASDKIYSNFSGNKEYFFWFKNIVIPTKHKVAPTNKRTLKHDRVYSRSEIEPLRQVIWEANVQFNDHSLYIKKMGVPNCWLTSSGPGEGREEFRRIDDEESAALNEIEFRWV